jgi:hypothetical protein
MNDAQTPCVFPDPSSSAASIRCWFECQIRHGGRFYFFGAPMRCWVEITSPEALVEILVGMITPDWKLAMVEPTPPPASNPIC